MRATYTSGTKLSKKREFILACAQFMVQRLGIQNSHKTLTFVTKKEADFDVSGCYGAATMAENDIYVYINPYLGVEKLLATLAHEMIHVAQFARGHLYKYVDENEQTVTTWCGKRYDETEYLELPWEIKAYEKQDQLVNSIVEILHS
jgi:hypothetical protein